MCNISYTIKSYVILYATLHSSGESVHPCLIPDLRKETVKLSPLSITLAVGFLCRMLIRLRHVPSLPNLLRVVIKKTFKFIKCFSAPIEMTT